MADAKDDDNLVDALTEDYARRFRAGERPSVEEYLDRHPLHADELRVVLPAVEMMEQHKPKRAAVPARVGEYRIIREIGRGGMGVVYEAEQEALGRRVAVKLLPAQFLANERARSRFQRESQTAARLHHTNIVPVFGVGSCDGHYFYVMQLIDGRGLDRLAGEAGGKDWYRTVARVGAEVADALSYAHSRGVLHRDIKPSNLLLDRSGTVWVTDFGVAKVIEEANLTQSGELVGTLRYMPPERFSGQCDALGDVYSLGVTLYELLTLRPAFPDTTPHHLIQLITQSALPRPRTLNRAVPRDLETIVLKACAREPGQRYATAGDLAEDLRRFLDDRPILARRAGPLERGWRWCRRNPALALTTAAAFLLMVAVTVVSVVAYVRTEAALSAEQREREHAEQSATLALEGLNRTYERFAPTRLVATPRATSEDGVELPPPALPPEVVPLLEDLLRTYEEIARSGGEFPRLRAQSAQAYHRIADIRKRLGQFEAAVGAYRVAIDLYDQLSSEIAEDVSRIPLARACNELGTVLKTLQRYDESDRMYERAVATLTDAPATFADRPECRYELARAYFTHSQRNMMTSAGGPGMGRPADAASEPIRRAVALLEGLHRDFPGEPEYRHLLACCLRETRPERFGKEKPDRAVPLLRGLVKDFPRVPDYQFDLCEALIARGPPGPMGKFKDGRRKESLKEAIALSARLVEQYPNVPDYAAAHARYLDLLGIAQFQEGKYREAEKLHREALKRQQKLAELFPDSAAHLFWLTLMERALGATLGRLGEAKEARVLLESAVRRGEALREKDSRLGGLTPFLGMAYSDLAEVLKGSGEPQLAEEARRKAAALGPWRGGGKR